MGNNVECIS